MSQGVLTVSGWGMRAEALRPCGEAVTSGEVVHCLSISSLFQQGSTYDPAQSLYDQASVSKPRVLLGWSTGAFVALEAACRWPSIADRVVLISGGLRFLAAKGNAFGQRLKMLKRLIASVENDCSLALSEFSDWALSDLEPSLRAEVSEREISSPEALTAILNYLGQIEISCPLSDRSPRVTVFHGMQDVVVPWQLGAEISRGFSSSGLFLSAKYGHELPLTKDGIEIIKAELSGCDH